MFGDLMTSLKHALIPTALLFLVGCSSYNVKYDYDASAPYGSYRTFDWYAASKKAKGKGSGTDPLMDQRVRLAVQAQLQAKGFAQETTGEPDFLVTYYPIYQNRRYRTTTSVGGGYGWGGRHWGYGVGTRFSTSQVHQYKEGTIVLEIVDGKSNQLVWQSAAEGALTGLQGHPEDAQEQINKAVTEMLSKFPPTRKN